MSFLRAARAALASQSRFPRVLLAFVAVTLTGLFISCVNNNTVSRVGPNHLAYVTLPSQGTVLLLNINSTTGVITAGPQTPPVQGSTPTGMVLSPSRKFLYVVNSRANSISIFSVNSVDGTLTLIGTPIQAGSAPNMAAIDPSGAYFLVTNNFSNNISVFSIDSNTGNLTEVPGSPYFANQSPTSIQFALTPYAEFVYVTNPGIGMVTGFSFSAGVLTPIPGTPLFSGQGATALTVDASDRFLFVANFSAINPPPNAATIGNISAYNIDPSTGELTTITGSPFTSADGIGPAALTVDPTNTYLYAVTAGSANSIWCFTINPSNGQLVAVSSSPFSLAAGGQFALFDPIGSYFYIGSPSAKGIQGYTYDSGTGAPTLIGGSPFSTGSPPGTMVLSE
ncbi:MAG: beta-propeller fold lactonase family protein [Terriglobales bacterium]